MSCASRSRCVKVAGCCDCGRRCRPVQEELEGPHQEQVRQLEDTIEKTRSLYFSSKRDAELARNELEQALEDAARDAEASEAAHKSQLLGLRRAIAAARAEHEQKANEWGEQLRQQTLQKDAAVARARKLDSLLQQAARQADQAHSESTKVRAEAKAARVGWMEQKAAFEKNVKQLASELQSVRAIVARQQAAAVERAEQLQSLQRKLTMDSRAAIDQHDALQQDLVKVREHAERTCAARETRARQLEESLLSTRGELQASQERVRQLESSAMVSARQNAQSISSLQRRLEQAEAGEAKAGALAVPPLQPGMCITSEEELNSFQKEQTDMQSKLAVCQSELRQAAAELRCLRSDRAELQQQVQSLTRSLADTQEKHVAVTSEEKRAQERVADLSRKLAAAEAACAEHIALSKQLEYSKLQQTKLAANLRNEFSRAKSQFAMQLSAITEERKHAEESQLKRVSAAEDLASAHKKKAQGYKQKLLLLWKRFQDLQDAFAAQESAHRVGVFQQKERLERVRRQLRSAATNSGE